MRREVDFIKFNPTQNMTILVKTKHPAEEYQRIASRMMSYDSVHAEQVGFIEQPDQRGASAHLQMAGGEFCGNACMALASWIARENGLGQDEWTEISLGASGAEQLVHCRVNRIADEYYCQVAMPVPHKLEQRAIAHEGREWSLGLVQYRDFLHVVIEVGRAHEELRRSAASLAKRLGAESASSMIGILLYKPETHELAPLIYVPQLDSMIWERGCGSGTASVGAYLAWKQQKDAAAEIRQPGGSIHVAASWQGEEIKSLQIGGSVGIVAQGKAYLEI
ncbi:hypothetical protein D478_03749 [Brevibacillus agri BAB-2500]|nr:hypothetical protein D478_03749 [Brevibacillus agri BAB-2500]